MKHIKNLKSKYRLINEGRDIFLTSKKQGDEPLALIMSDLEEKIISFTDEIESRLDDMSNSIQNKCSDLFNTVSKMPSKDMLEPNMLLDVLDKLTEIKSESNDSLEDILKYVDSSIDETFDDDISFLKFSSIMARDLGDIQEAVKIQELTRKRLTQLSELVHDICCSTESKINSQVFSILEVLDHKYSIFSIMSGEAKFFDESDSETGLEEDTRHNNSPVRIPRTNLELKRHLKKEGFELHRHNGSHQIYKNDEGEVRLIPARRGNHVLAAKTAKKIYQGVTASSN